jgi:hypothetical protein
LRASGNSSTVTFIALVCATLGGYLPVHARSGEMPLFMLIFVVIGETLFFVDTVLFLAWMMRKKDEMRGRIKGSLI